MNDELTAIVEAAFAIAEKEEQLMNQLRQALVQGDDPEALRIARSLCGVAAYEQSYLIHQG
jgi:hypothetical protein